MRGTSKLPYGPGTALWKYWTAGKGLAKWIGAVHKWSTLHGLLKAAGVPGHMVNGLTTNIITHVLPSYMKTGYKKELTKCEFLSGEESRYSSLL